MISIEYARKTYHSCEAAVQHIDEIPVFDRSAGCGAIALVEKRSSRCRGNAYQSVETNEGYDSAILGFRYRHIGSHVEGDGPKQKDEGPQSHLLIFQSERGKISI